MKIAVIQMNSVSDVAANIAYCGSNSLRVFVDGLRSMREPYKIGSSLPAQSTIAHARR